MVGIGHRGSHAQHVGSVRRMVVVLVGDGGGAFRACLLLLDKAINVGIDVAALQLLPDSLARLGGGGRGERVEKVILVGLRYTLVIHCSRKNVVNTRGINTLFP